MGLSTENNHAQRRRRKSRRENKGASEDVDSDGEEDSEGPTVARLFQTRATGTVGGQKVFFRFPDLDAFVEDLQAVMPGQYQRFKRTRKALEQVYEETIQLQIDFGTRTQKGLTLHGFQVFIQKAARKAGLSVTGLLVALLDDLQS